MDWFQTSCPLCLGDVTLHVGDCLLVRAETGSTRARFECPSCHGDASIRVPERMAAALQALGHGASEHPSRRTPARMRHDDPPLTWDDLLDLHELLAQPDWFDRLVTTIDQSSQWYGRNRT